MTRYIKEDEVSEMTGLAVQTLRNHRHRGVGIPYIKASARAIRYSVDEVVSYMEARKIFTQDCPEGGNRHAN